MVKIDITTILSPDLRFRNMVSDLLAYVKNLDDKQVHIDFSNVTFATRCFIDAYYNVFICENSELNEIKVDSINLPDDIKYMLNIVSKTQSGNILYEEPVNSSVLHFPNMKELADHLGALNLKYISEM